MAVDSPARERVLLTIPETAELLGIKNTKAYEMASHGELPVVRIGRLVKVHLPTLQAQLAAKVAGTEESSGEVLNDCPAA